MAKQKEFVSGNWQLVSVPKSGDGEKVLAATSGFINSIEQLEEWGNQISLTWTLAENCSLVYIEPGSKNWVGELPVKTSTGSTAVVERIPNAVITDDQQRAIQQTINRQRYDQDFADQEEFRQQLARFKK